MKDTGGWNPGGSLFTSTSQTMQGARAGGGDGNTLNTG